MSRVNDRNRRAAFRRGEMVEVRSAGEILATLDAGGLLLWESILSFKQAGFRALDLVSVEVAPPEGSREAGVREFKRKWGGKLLDTPVYQYWSPSMRMWRTVTGRIRSRNRFSLPFREKARPGGPDVRVTKRFVPPSPPLSLSALLPGRAHGAATFPFSAPRGRWYFLGRNALWHGLRALSFEYGEEVLVPAYNSGAEVDAVIAAGLSPRFFRVGLDLTPDLGDIQSAISRRTRALLAIHYFGFPQPLDELTAFCARKGLLLIEDCALALFSHDGSVPLGTTGVVSVFSPHKTLPLPHGGFLVVNDLKIHLPSEPAKLPSSYGVKLLAGRLLDGLEMRYPQIIRRGRSKLRLRSVERNGATGTGGTADNSERFEPANAKFGASSLIQRLALQAEPAHVMQERRRNYLMLGSLLPRESQLLPNLRAGVCPLFFPFLVVDQQAAVRELRGGRGLSFSPTGRCPIRPSLRVLSPRQTTCVSTFWPCPYTRGCRRKTSNTWQTPSLRSPLPRRRALGRGRRQRGWR